MIPVLADSTTDNGRPEAEAGGRTRNTETGRTPDSGSPIRPEQFPL
jgi:hypothetical protein